jgi:hypothetical protein
MPFNASYARFIFGKFFTSTIILYILLFAQNFYSCKKWVLHLEASLIVFFFSSFFFILMSLSRRRGVKWRRVRGGCPDHDTTVKAEAAEASISIPLLH